jgi:hypothetical protein
MNTHSIFVKVMQELQRLYQDQEDQEDLKDICIGCGNCGDFGEFCNDRCKEIYEEQNREDERLYQQWAEEQEGRGCGFSFCLDV